MDFLGALINGIIAGLGMFIVMTVLGALTFFFLKPWITKTVTEIWQQVKEAKMIEIKLDGNKEPFYNEELLEKEFYRQMEKLGLKKEVLDADKNQGKTRKQSDSKM